MSVVDMAEFLQRRVAKLEVQIQGSAELREVESLRHEQVASLRIAYEAARTDELVVALAALTRFEADNLESQRKDKAAAIAAEYEALLEPDRTDAARKERLAELKYMLDNSVEQASS